MHTKTRLSRFGSLARSLTLALAATVMLLAQPAVHAAGAAPGAAPTPSNLVKITTNMGDIVIELLPDRAPLTVANFLRYVKEGYYTNTLIHRVVANFVIQGGGHDATS